MLNNFFFHDLTRQYNVLFGTLFDNITVLRYKYDDKEELERFKVPLIYGPKDKYNIRPSMDSDYFRNIDSILPRMSYEETGIQYDKGRQQERMIRIAKHDSISGVTNSQYIGVPYDIAFTLSIKTRNINQLNQILEQILPFFTPDLTVTVDQIPDIGHVRDIPIILTGVDKDIQYEGDWTSIREINATLNFIMKVYFYGPVSETGIIRKVITNIFNDPSLKSGYIIRANMTDGEGNYFVNDIVYQGTSLERTAQGTVIAWDSLNNKLQIGGAQGQFKSNNTVWSESSNAAYILSSFVEEPMKLATITIEPDPIDAEPTDNYGYDIQIVEDMSGSTGSQIADTVLSDFTHKWTFDDDNGIDIKSTANAISSGGVSYEDGIIGRAAVFNGIDGKFTTIEIPPMPSKISVSCWIKGTGIGNNDTFLFSRANLGNGNLGGFVFQNDSSGKLRTICYDVDGLAAFVYGNTIIRDGEWHHCVFTYDGTDGDGLKLYLDGQLDVLTRSIPSGFGGDINSSGVAWIIGNWPGISNTWMEGSIDDLRVYDRALSLSEIQDIYNLSTL